MRDIFRRNLGYKVAALFLTIILWMWISSQTNTALFVKNNINVPLVAHNQPANLVIVSSIPPITVRIDNTQGVSVNDLFAYVDLKDAAAGEHSFKVHMDAPNGVTIESISPSTVVMTLDLVKDKIVPVLVTVSGNPASGFTVGDPIINPSVVNVRGPTSILDKLENVVVDINVSGSKESMRVARPVTFKDIKGEGIFAPDPNLESLNAFPETVEILVLIYPKELASKTVPIKVSASGQPAKGMMVQMVTPIPNQVKLLGDAEVLKGIQYVSLGTIDINGLSSNKVADFLLNSVTLPKGVSFSEGTKLSVMVYIVASPVDKIIKDIPVEIKNLPQGLTSTAISPIEITVNGNPDILNTLKTGDISAWVDATDLKAGTYPDVTVYWSAPAGVSVIQVPKVELVLQSKQ